MNSVAIVGAGNTAHLVKDTPAQEIWTFNHMGMHAENGRYPFTPDLVVDIHHEDAIREPTLGKDMTDYWTWLHQKHPYPVLMQEKYPKFPSSEKFPREEIKALFPSNIYVNGEQVDLAFASSLDWVLGLAVLRGFTDIYLYGCTFGSTTEYVYQVGGNYFWTGVLNERGINLHMQKGDMFYLEQEDYGYVSWVRVDRKTIRQDLKELKAKKKDIKGDNEWRYKGAIDALANMIEWVKDGDTIGRNAFERLYQEVWNEIIAGVAFFKAGDQEYKYRVLMDEGRICALLHYLRVCDLMDSVLEVDEIDVNTPKPVKHW